MAITLKDEENADLYPPHPFVGGDSAGASSGGGGGTPSAHHLTHENGGADQISVTGLTGVLANPQPPIIGAGAAQAVAGNDSRLTNARTPTAHATTHQPGGTDAMAVDAVAATGSLRTLGSGAAQACGGTDSRLSDARTPTAHATTHQPGGTDAMAVDAVAATGSLRTLGAGAAQACGGTDTRLSDARTPLAHVHPTTDITSGRFIAARMLDGATAGFLLTAKGTGVDPAYTSLVTTRLTADNSAIAAAAPTTALQVANLTQAAVVNDEWDIEWILEIANSVATDVFVFNVTSTAGTLTGRYTIEGANGVPSTGAAVVKLLMLPAGTLSTASANAPGNTGTIALVTTVVIRARVKLTVSNGTIQLLCRAGTSGALTSGTATVKAQSQMIATRIA